MSMGAYGSLTFMPADQGGGGPPTPVVESVNSGAGVFVDNTDPANPVVTLGGATAAGGVGWNGLRYENGAPNLGLRLQNPTGTTYTDYTNYNVTGVQANFVFTLDAMHLRVGFASNTNYAEVGYNSITLHRGVADMYLNVDGLEFRNLGEATMKWYVQRYEYEAADNLLIVNSEFETGQSIWRNLRPDSNRFYSNYVDFTGPTSNNSFLVGISPESYAPFDVYPMGEYQGAFPLVVGEGSGTGVSLFVGAMDVSGGLGGHIDFGTTNCNPLFTGGRVQQRARMWNNGDMSIEGGLFTSDVMAAPFSGFYGPPWKFGWPGSGAPTLDPINFLNVEIDGTVYHIALVNI